MTFQHYSPCNPYNDVFEKTKHDFKIKILNGISTLGNESATSTDLILIGTLLSVLPN